MKKLVIFTLLCCAASALSLAEKGDPSVTDTPAGEFGDSTTEPPKTTPTTPTTHKTTTTTPTTTPTTTTTTKTTTTTTTTPKTTTTTPKTTTTTPKTTKTTPKTTTTTPKTTTTTPKTTTTTPKTTTTTPKTTTTTPKTTPATTTAGPVTPTAATNVSVGNYTMTENKTVICIMAQMALQIRLDAPKANAAFIVQPKLVKVYGFCKDDKANLTLVFKEGFITFMFTRDKKDVFVDALSLSLTYPLDKQGKYGAKNASLRLFPVKTGHSYSCKAQSVFVGGGLNLEVTQGRLQAFNLTKSNDFGPAEACAADRPDYRVAIAVGVTLLVLIVVVVVAYLLGRRRRADGYQSL